MGIEVIDAIANEVIWSRYAIEKQSDAETAFHDAAIVTNDYNYLFRKDTLSAGQTIVRFYVMNLQ